MRDGIQQLGIIETDLNDAAVTAVKQAIDIQEHQAAQLQEIEEITEVASDVEALKAQ